MNREPYTTECIHLGAFERLAGCSSCRGNVRKKVYGCNHKDHTKATIQYCSKECPDYSPSIPLQETKEEDTMDKDTETPKVEL